MAKHISKDISGQPFGNLVALRRSTNEWQPRDTVWVCLCTICNTEVEVPSKLLLNKKRQSCGKEECRNVVSKFTKDQRLMPKVSSTVLERIREAVGRQSVSYFQPYRQGLFLLEYILGSTIEEISETYGVVPNSLDLWIRKMRDQFNSTHEIRLRMNEQKMPLIKSQVDTALRHRFTNEELADRLSEDNAATLTNYEIVYAWTYFQTGNNDTALQQSSFLDCLPEANQSTKALLGIYLREKWNITQYLKQLQAKQLGETYVDKALIQQSLLDQIKQLKEICAIDGGAGNSRTQLLNAINLLGKTIGAFTENVNVTEVKAGDAIDYLLNLAKIEIEGPIIDAPMVTYEPTDKPARD